MSHYKQYPAYNGSNIPDISLIPEGWSIKPLKHHADFFNSNVDKKSYEDGIPTRLCNYTDVYYNEFISPDLPFMEATASESEIQRFTLKAGDVIITKDSEDPWDIGVPAMVKEDMPGVVCGYHLTMIRAKDLHTSRFIHRLLQSLPIKTYLAVNSPGITRFGLGQDVIGSLPVPTPPSELFKTIADKIDRETIRIDALIAKKTRFIELLKEKRQALITHAVTKGLNPNVKMKTSGVEWIGEVPEHWEVVAISRLFKEVNRTGDNNLPVLSISIHSGITDRELDPDERDRQTYLIEDRTKYKRVMPGDLAYNMMRAWQGGFGAATVDGLVSPAYVVAEPSRNLVTSYIECVLRTPMAIEEMRRFSRGIADFRMRLYWENFREVKVPTPPFAEQREIMDFLTVQAKRIESLAERTKASIELLKERRSAFITAAVTGQIDLRSEGNQ